MSHWFDGFTKNLARTGTLPRRSFLKLIVATAGARLVEGIPFAALVAVALPSPAFAQPNTCTWRRAGNSISNEVTLSREGITFHQQLSYDLAQQVAKLNAMATKGDALVFKISVTAKKGGPVSSTTNYGRAVQGAKNATLRSRDGKSFEGEVDGRAFTSRDRKMKFADGQPAPKIVVEPSVMKVMTDLLAEARKSIASCRPAASSAPRTRAIFFGPGRNWYVPGDMPHSCDICLNGCGEAYSDDADDPECLIHALDCWPELLVVWAGCVAECKLPGGGCLPVPCGGTFGSCAPGDTCFDWKGENPGELCCEAPGVVCKNICCGKTITSCLPDGSCGCDTNEITCGNQCCDPAKKESCSNGICCPHGQQNSNGICCPTNQTNFKGKCCLNQNICGEVCCDELSKCVDKKKSFCCGFTEVVCAGVCCKTGEQCVNGKCCSKPCGNVCCGSAQACLNGKCISKACPSVQVTCITEEDPNQKGPLIAVSHAICCPPKVSCCSGKCCKPGEICCAKGVPFGCHDPSLCLA